MTCLWNTFGKTLSAAYPTLVVLAALIPWMSMSGESSLIDAAFNVPIEQTQTVCVPDDPLKLKLSDSCTDFGSARAEDDTTTQTQS